MSDLSPRKPAWQQDAAAAGVRLSESAPSARFSLARAASREVSPELIVWPVRSSSRGVPVLDLDDNAVRNSVLANPVLAIGEHTPVCLDEYQRAPDVLDVIKARLNREGTLPGRQF